MSLDAKSGATSGLSFVSESVIEERRQRRQEEYEKNRTEDMPLGLCATIEVSVI